MRTALVVAISLGCLLQGYIHFFEAKANLFIGLLVFALIPYAVAALLACFRRTARVALGFALGLLAGDLFAYDWVFLSSKGSMAGYLLLVMPLLNLLLLGPAGGFLAWVCARFMNRRSKEDA